MAKGNEKMEMSLTPIAPRRLIYGVVALIAIGCCFQLGIAILRTEVHLQILNDTSKEIQITKVIANGLVEFSGPPVTYPPKKPGFFYNNLVGFKTKRGDVKININYKNEIGAEGIATCSFNSLDNLCLASVWFNDDRSVKCVCDSDKTD